jgi:hypothetical protein
LYSKIGIEHVAVPALQRLLLIHFDARLLQLLQLGVCCRGCHVRL